MSDHPKETTDIERRRPDQPVNVIRIPATEPRKVPIEELPEPRRQRREQQTDEPYVIQQALPLVIKEFTWTGGPDVVER